MNFSVPISFIEDGTFQNKKLICVLKRYDLTWNMIFFKKTRISPKTITILFQLKKPSMK